MTLLIATPAPKPTEALWGYLLRVSEQNGCENPRQVLTAAGLGKERFSLRFSHTHLAPLLNMESSELAHMSYGEEGCENWYLFGTLCGQSSMSGLRLRLPAICPCCVSENQSIDGFWDLAAATVCPTHGRYLVEECPNCKQPLSRFRPGMLTCRCKADLTGVRNAIAPADTIQWMRVLQKKVLQQPLSGLANERRFPLNHLEAIPLRELLSIVGKLNSAGVDAGLPDGCGVTALANWPECYYDYLKEVGHHAVAQGGNKKVGLLACFSRLHAALFKTTKDKMFTGFLLEEFLNFGTTKWNKHIVYARPNGDVMSLRQLAKAMGATLMTVSRLVTNGQLKVEAVGMNGNAMRYIARRADIVMPTLIEGKLLTVQAAAKLIGIPRPVLMHLKKSGHFQVKHQYHCLKGFHEQDVDAFKQQLVAMAPHREDEFPSNQYMSLYHALTRCKFGSTDRKAGFAEAYLLGTIRSVGRWGDTTNNIYFDKQEILNFAFEGLRSKHQTVSRAAVARELSCPHAAINQLVERGLLTSESNTKGFSYITKTSLADFLEKYSSCSNIAKRYKSTARRVANVAKEVGLLGLDIEGRNGEYSSFILKKNMTSLDQIWEKVSLTFRRR